MRWQVVCAVALFSLTMVPAFAQSPNEPKRLDATCTFADGKQMRVSYAPLLANKKVDLPNDRIWAPENLPMDIFTQANVSIEGKQIPAGAYTMYIIPGGKWTLVLNKDVTAGSKYDEKEDLLRASMQMGQLGDLEPFEVAFAQLGPKQCNLRIYYGKVGTWTEFDEQ